MAQRFERLFLRPDERGIVIGMTGTGKSTLCRSLLANARRLAIIDPKRDFDYPGVPVYDSAEKIIRAKSTRFIYRPSVRLASDIRALLSDVDMVFRHCFFAENIVIYIDDIVGIIPETKPPPYMRICYQMGRSKNVSLLACTQRPAWIPRFMMSEANKKYVFHLEEPADIKRVREVTPGYDPAKLPDEHTFFFYDFKLMKKGGAEMKKLNLGVGGSE